jgi:hypothetical protein
MTTRAIITIEKVPFVAIHLDGYPKGVGRKLINTRASDKLQIINAIRGFGIDFIQKEFMDTLNEKRIEEIAYSHNLTIEQVKEGMRRVVQSFKDHLIGDIKEYEDWCEYQYNLNKNKEWEFTRYPGKWNGSKHKFRDLRSVFSPKERERD